MNCYSFRAKGDKGKLSPNHPYIDDNDDETKNNYGNSTGSL